MTWRWPSVDKHVPRGKKGALLKINNFEKKKGKKKQKQKSLGIVINSTFDKFGS